jgi:hypothetical protein
MDEETREKRERGSELDPSEDGELVGTPSLPSLSPPFFFSHLLARRPTFAEGYDEISKEYFLHYDQRILRALLVLWTQSTLEPSIFLSPLSHPLLTGSPSSLFSRLPRFPK